MAEPYVKEALFLSSSSLYQECFVADRFRDDAKLQAAATRYLYRMGSRATPFGVLAGLSIGSFGERNDLQVGNLDQARRFCRLDQGIVQQHIDAAKQQVLDAPALNAGLMVSLNNSAWNAPDGVRFISSSATHGTIAYRLTRARRTAATDAVLTALAEGPMIASDLNAILCDRLKAGPERVGGFLASLAHNQLLKVDPEVFVTGDESGSDVVTELAESPLDQSTKSLADAHSVLQRISSDPKANIEVYKRVADEVHAASADEGSKVDMARVVHVDLHKEGANPVLSRKTVDVIANELWSVRSLLVHQRDDLNQFATAFSSRFGDRAVPLLQALDDDYGVAFGSRSQVPQPLIDGFPFAKRSDRTAIIRPSDLMIMTKLERALRMGDEEIVIDAHDLETLDNENLDFPSSFATMGIFHAESPQALAADQFTFEPTATHAPSGARLLSRFCVGSSELQSRVRDQIEAFEGNHPDAIVAEFAHLPEGRVGNVVLRPVLREYELPYLGRSGAPENKQIKLTDLFVSVRDGIVTLRSLSLGKEIIPRITTAHNYSNPTNLPLYQFMGALERQHEPAVGFSWPASVQNLPYLPKVRSGRLLLSRQRWLVAPHELEQMLGVVEQDGAIRAVRDLIERLALPVRVRSKRADNFVDLDLDSERDAHLFIEEARRSRARGLKLEESFNDEQSAVDAAGNAFKHEVVIPFFRRHPADIPSRRRAASRSRHLITSPGHHTPGSRWIYAKLYAGTEAIDQVVANIVPYIARSLAELGWEDCFFVRYWEGGSHLRLRIGSRTGDNSMSARARFESSLDDMIANGSIHHFEYATYFPEYDRYGGEATMPLVEKIFTADSLAAANGIAAIRRATNREQLRWLFALTSMNSLVDALGFDTDRKLQIFERMAQGYAAEFGIDKVRRRWLNDRYRQHKDTVDRIFLGPAGQAGTFGPTLAQRDAQIARLVATDDTGELAGNARLAESLLHMTANRIFPDQGRTHECVLFHLLDRGMRAAAARTSKRAERLTPAKSASLSVGV